MTIKFYTVDHDYIEYLKKIESQVPDIIYDENNKFFCGVVTEVNGFKYFAPITSFKTKQKTNLLIYNSSNEAIASIRFCFMIPVDEKYLTIKDISKVRDEKYKRLLSTELAFCKQNKKQIENAARRVYSYGIDPKSDQYRNCCKFKVIESAAQKYR